MKYSVRPTTKFQKDLKRVQRRGYDLSLLTDIIKKIKKDAIFSENRLTILENHAIIIFVG